MAEQSGEKTQDATQHRRQQAREQGQVAYSQDLGSAALLIVGVLLLRFWGEQIFQASSCDINWVPSPRWLRTKEQPSYKGERLS